LNSLWVAAVGDDAVLQQQQQLQQQSVAAAAALGGGWDCWDCCVDQQLLYCC
jgi:hypothetical protein